jgi:hypothetical protein
LTLYIYIATLFVSFTSANETIYERAIGSAVGFVLYSADWLNDSLSDYFVSVITLRNSIIRKPMWKKKSTKHLPKETVSNYGRTVSRTLFVVSEVLQFRNNNPQLQPTDVTVTLLFCVRQ